MALRICLVTPFAWSQPHEVNEHVAGVAQELRVLGHAVTILASSNRAADLAAGRRALAQRVARRRASSSRSARRCRSRGAAAWACRSACARTSRARSARAASTSSTASSPALPSLSYLALREAESLAVATFFSPERLVYPPGRAQREKLLGRIDVLLATSRGDGRRGGRCASRATTALVSRGRRHDAVRADATRSGCIVLEWRPTERPLLRAVAAHARRASRLAADAAAHEAAVDAAVRPADARRPRRRADAHATRRAARRSSTRRRSSSPRPSGLSRLALEAAAAGAAVASPPGTHEQPQLARPRWAASPRTSLSRAARARGARASAERPDVHRRRARARGDLREPARRGGARAKRDADPLADRDWIVVDLHMHTSASHDCRVAAGAPARPRGGRGARRDRGHRPQRLLRRAGGRSSSHAAATSSSSPARR